MASTAIETHCDAEGDGGPCGVGGGTAVDAFDVSGEGVEEGEACWWEGAGCVVAVVGGRAAVGSAGISSGCT
eukprot:scaffold13321_cov193-Alexandrium_tamarense.AAC.20